EHLFLKCTQALLLFVVFVAARLDFGNASEKIRTGEIACRDGADRVTFVDGGDEGHEVAFSLRLPYLNSGGKSASRCAGDTDTLAKLLTAIFRLIVAHDAATNEISIVVENPEGIEPGCKGALQEFVCGFRGVHLRLPGQIAEA